MDHTKVEVARKQLEVLTRQESELQFDTFTSVTALEVGMRLVERARHLHKAVSIEIRRNGQQIFQHAMDGTSIDHADWIRRKNNVVDRYGHSSYYVGTQFRAKGTTFEEAVTVEMRDFAAAGGAFPVIVRNVGVVGSIAVSGLPQVEDHELIVAGLREFLGVPV